MRDVFNFMVKAARYFGGIAFSQSKMKQIFLVFMATVSLTRAIAWENEVTLSAVCDNSTMHLGVNFTSEFQGTIYQSRGYFNPKCSYMVPINMNVTEVNLSMPFGSCDIQIAEVDNRTTASTDVVIQMHSLLDSIYDTTVNVSCEIDNFHLINETEVEDSNPFEARGLVNSWLEFKNGLVLFGEVGEPIESTLYLVVNVRDDGSNEDMVVRSCIAHTDKNVTNATTLHQLSDFYGCPDPSAVLPNFTVIRSGNDQAVMFAYAPVSNFSLIVSGGRMSVSCGITICESSCPAHCNESPVQLPLSDYVTKIVVTRSDGAVMPDTLRDLNRHNDRSRRMLDRPKRSLRSFFSSLFRWESQVVVESSSEGNVTNMTTTRKAHGLIVKHAIVAKDVLISSKKPVNVTLMNKTSNLIKDEFHMDWETFRFIALMVICMFITVVACYCCYADDIKSRRSQSVF